MLPPRSPILYSCTPSARHAALTSESKNAFTACAGIVDDLSRDRALEVAGPSSGPPPPPLLRSKALQLAKLYGWQLIIDAFASESNSLLQRFFAPYAEPAAESEDAFTACDWDQSTCPKCGLAHREALFAYLPLWQHQPPTGQNSSAPPSSPTRAVTSAFAPSNTAPRFRHRG
jgi:hypothetical protein